MHTCKRLMRWAGVRACLLGVAKDERCNAPLFSCLCLYPQALLLNFTNFILSNQMHDRSQTLCQGCPVFQQHRLWLKLLITLCGKINFMLRDESAHGIMRLWNCTLIRTLSNTFPDFSWMAGIRSSPCHLGVPYNHISVWVLGDTAFLRVEVEDFCCVAAGDGDKSILVHFATVLWGGGTEQLLWVRGHSGWQESTEAAEQRSALNCAAGNSFPPKKSSNVWCVSTVACGKSFRRPRGSRAEMPFSQQRWENAASAPCSSQLLPHFTAFSVGGGEKLTCCCFTSNKYEMGCNYAVNTL